MQIHEITWNGIRGPVTGIVTGETVDGYLVADVGDGKAVLVHPKSVIKNEWRPPSCVDWDACKEEHEREIAEEDLLRELAESEAEERAMDGYYRDKYG